ncbi:MAG TPA: hypothetical protein VI037_05750 [Nitrososphaera sp.]
MGKMKKCLEFNESNNTENKNKTLLLLFQAKDRNGGDSGPALFKQKLRVYHLAQHTSPESLAVNALCENVYPVDWDLPHHLILLPDELDKLAKILLCRKCMQKAVTLPKEWDDEEE